MPDYLHLSISPLELVVRGTVIYWLLFILFRFVLRRDAGPISVTDLLFVVLIADASQNAMAGEYRNLPDGMVLIATLAFWNYSMDFAAYRNDTLRKFIEGNPVVLIRDGKLIRRSMRKEMITLEDIHVAMRENGLQDLSQIKLATLEVDGDITVVKASTHDMSGGR